MVFWERKKKNQGEKKKKKKDGDVPILAHPRTI